MSKKKNDNFETIDADELAKKAKTKLQPKHSYSEYIASYNQYLIYCKSVNKDKVVEDTLLSYFEYLISVKNYAPTTVWAKHSMIKSMLVTEEKVDINKFPQLHLYMSKILDGYEKKVAPTFEDNQIKDFLLLAPDKDYLLDKVIAILAISGACRGQETTDLKFDNVVRQGDMYKVTVYQSKTKKNKSFMIDSPFLKWINKYIQLRPGEYKDEKFLFGYNKGISRRQHVGKSRVASSPKLIAEFLNLPDPKNYTGHSYKRTSLTVLSNTGATLQSVQDHGGHKSATVAKHYCANTDSARIERSKAISTAIMGQEDTTENAHQPNNFQRVTSVRNVGLQSNLLRNSHGPSTSNMNEINSRTSFPKKVNSNFHVDNNDTNDTSSPHDEFAMEILVPDDISQNYFEELIPDQVGYNNVSHTPPEKKVQKNSSQFETFENTSPSPKTLNFKKNDESNNNTIINISNCVLNLSSIEDILQAFKKN